MAIGSIAIYPFSNTVITPLVLRQILKTNSGGYIAMSRAEKHQLLHYCLEDRNYHNLIGLVLLPMVNNTFVAFNNNTSLELIVYICDANFLHAKLLAYKNEAVLVNV